MHGAMNFAFDAPALHKRHAAFEHNHSSRPSRGERLVEKFDSDGNGKIAMAELEGTRLGKRMSVDRFARLDRDGDLELSADELNHGRRGKGYAFGHFSKVAEASVLSQIADALAASAEAESQEDTLADLVIDRLDSDDSGALNSEEVAGTKLANLIGADFYTLDADKSGTLDKAELSELLREKVFGLTETPADDPEPEKVVAEVDDDAPIDVGLPSEDVPTAAPDPTIAVLTPDTANDAPSGTLSTNNRIASSFEAALQLLQNGQQTSTFDAVNAFYEDVRRIIGA